MTHYLYAHSATLDKELSKFEFFGAVDVDEYTTEEQAQASADEYAAMLNESQHLTATDWTGRIMS